MGIWFAIFIMTCIFAVFSLMSQFISKMMMKRKQAKAKAQVRQDIEEPPAEREAYQADGETVETMKTEDTISIACASCGHEIIVSRENPPEEIECEMCGRRGPLEFQ